MAFLTSGQLGKEKQVPYLKEVLRDQNRPQDGLSCPGRLCRGRSQKESHTGDKLLEGIPMEILSKQTAQCFPNYQEHDSK